MCLAPVKGAVILSGGARQEIQVSALKTFQGGGREHDRAEHCALPIGLS